MIKTFAIITVGLVSNMIEIDEADADSITAFSAVAIPAGQAVAIGWSVSGSVFSPPAPPVIPLLTAQATAWGNIKAKRSQIKHGGVLVAGKWFHTDEESRSQYSIMYAAISVNALPDTYIFNATWKTMDGSIVPMTTITLKTIVNAGMASDSANYANAEAHRTAMLLSATPETYNFSTGWTVVYPL